MRKTSLASTTCIALVIGAVLAPAATFAGSAKLARGGQGALHGARPPGSQQHGGKGTPGFAGRGGGKDDHGGKGQHGANGHDGSKGHHPSKGHHGGQGHHGFKERHGFRGYPWVTAWAPPVYFGYGYGGYGYGAPAYVSPPTYYAPDYYARDYAAPAVYAAPAGAVSLARTPPMPSVIEYPNGRFELVGDGITTSYTWVWIPTAPPPPPDPPAAPPTPPSDAPTALPASRTPLYRWTDEQGVVHWTNRADAVPPRARPQTRHPSGS